MKRAPTDLPRLSREEVLTAAKLTAPEARFLVANYYASQDARKRGDMQLRHLGADRASEGLPDTLKYTTDRFADIEADTQKMLGKYAEGHPIGQWMIAQHGIGPVISAGFLAHLDIEHAPTVGHWWRFAGLDPSSKWLPSEKRPWNAELKQICWHAGQCFKRSSNSPHSIYGKLYRQQKALVEKRNEAGEYAERAKVFITKSADVRKTLKEGKLPANNLDSQACRFATKIFLSHVHALYYWYHTNEPPPKPFAVSVLGHAHEIKIPDTDMFPGFAAAYYGKRPLRKAA